MVGSESCPQSTTVDVAFYRFVFFVFVLHVCFERCYRLLATHGNGTDGSSLPFFTRLSIELMFDEFRCCLGGAVEVFRGVQHGFTSRPVRHIYGGAEGGTAMFFLVESVR